IVDKNQNIVINTDSSYVINSIRATGIKLINSDLIDRMNDLINLRTGKTYFNHVKAHSGIYGNEQADRLAFL
ncbi:5563_t:CDS:1, partial [Cetraspora pellucida]